jgi:hypothetical protein
LIIRKKIFGDEHPDVADSLSNLAILLVTIGDLPQALAFEQRALAMYQKFLPPEHPNIQTAREMLEEIECRIKPGKS